MFYRQSLGKPVMRPIPESQARDPQGIGPSRTGIERNAERVIVLIGKSLAALALAGFAWSLLVAFAFVSSAGHGPWAWADPRSSSLGPWLTVLVVWPAMGALGFLLQGAAEGLFLLATKGYRRLANPGPPREP